MAGIVPERRGETPRVSVAPMMQRTDRHYRALMRILTRRTLLYTEMVTTGALLRGRDRPRYLDFSTVEHPISLQVGGDDPQALADCARLAQDRGYDEVNLNVGCPSDRVQSGRFGACLMAKPQDVARAIEAMRAVVSIPVTVKHRIGVDELDRYEDMLNFVDVVSRAGADRFSVHARKAWLSGLSPKENRTVPPLRYEDVYRLKAERPHLDIELNGGVTRLDEIEAHLERLDAVMVGRAAYDNPMMFATVDERFFGECPRPALGPFDVVERMMDYAAHWVEGGGRLHHVTRHMLSLFSGWPGGRHWRRRLSEATRDDAGIDVLRGALETVRSFG